MRSPQFHSFDTKGFSFFAKSVLVLVLVVAAFHYGTLAIASKVTQNGIFNEKAAQKESTLDKLAKEKVEEQLFLATRTIEGQTLENIVPKTGKYVGVDLVHMKVLLYQDGNIIETLPVVSKGKPGSHWETPSGVYSVETKEKDHFSSIGKVNMPYSMQFFGNFFIHGWPTESDGTPVPQGYSGGCVRLSTLDAEKVFNFSDVGTGLFVYDDPSVGEDLSYVEIRNIPKPSVTAESYIVADVDTGEVYAEKNANQAYPMASVTKLMTAIVANETISFDKEVPVDGSGVWVPPDVTDKKQETMSVGQLYYPLLLESNNLVANSLARYYGTKLFLQWMNAKAAAIGMTDTHYVDPSGLSPYDTSTVSDLFKLARYIDHKKSFILKITDEPFQAETASDGKTYHFENKTHFLDREDYVGGKIGFTDEALETMVALFNEKVGNETHTIAFVVLKSDNRKNDILELLNWFKRSATVQQ